MASIDIQERIGPKRDGLGVSCFVLHIGVGGFVLGGWLLSSTEALLLYLVVLPAMATQWAINRGSCLINNVETYIRTGRWRDPHCGEEGKFLLMMCDWFFSTRPSPQAVDRFSYSIVIFLWFLALGHVSWLTHI
jgi:hypothetical protein